MYNFEMYNHSLNQIRREFKTMLQKVQFFTRNDCAPLEFQRVDGLKAALSASGFGSTFVTGE